MTEIESIKEEMQKLQDRINELEEKEKQKKTNKVWQPKDCERVYLLCTDGSINHIFYDITAYPYYYQGNIFKTKEEAEIEREYRKVKQEMKAFTSVFVPHKTNYYIVYNFEEERIYVFHNRCTKENYDYFESSEKAHACIESIGEERLKKYYFKVKE